MFSTCVISSCQVAPHLRCDLLHSINKVVNLSVQLGTLQNHCLHLFDGRIHLSIWITGTHRWRKRLSISDEAKIQYHTYKTLPIYKHPAFKEILI